MMISSFTPKYYNKSVNRKRKTRTKEVVNLSVRERILALRLLEKQKEKPELAKQLGIDIKMVEKTKEKKK